eukprot:CAMPEP_0183567532 /NCGR_PEP_ID=MMETSP0371-20130417/114582_1 /TAXON_ID=268820 /ORGANISM="Peridinium aciculiferum, Strain PAER-2" /LENGTH=183 /DNA_ID=CAMNT_0025776911 /DNA_START=12 /DNA_END=563 /DNA_ORIENTATION=+
MSSSLIQALIAKQEREEDEDENEDDNSGGASRGLKPETTSVTSAEGSHQGAQRTKVSADFACPDRASEVATVDLINFRIARFRILKSCLILSARTPNHFVSTAPSGDKTKDDRPLLNKTSQTPSLAGGKKGSLMNNMSWTSPPGGCIQAPSPKCELQTLLPSVLKEIMPVAWTNGFTGTGYTK